MTKRAVRRANWLEVFSLSLKKPSVHFVQVTEPLNSLGLGFRV